MSRPLTKKEKEVLSYFLSFPTRDAAYYREQLNHAVVSSTCGCEECGSISLEIDRTAAQCAPGKDSFWLVRGDDNNGEDMMLDISNGWLCQLEVTGPMPDRKNCIVCEYLSEDGSYELNPDAYSKPKNLVS